MEHMGHHMEHSAHDHDHNAHGHDHNSMLQTSESPVTQSSHVMMDHSSMMHMMTFHFGYNETILFEFWKISSVGGLIGSMFGIFFMAALYEGLKYYREYLFWKTYNSLQYRSVDVPTNKNTAPEENSVVHVVGEVIHRQPPTMLSANHAFQTLLHIIQIVVSYFLMLIFMTYNVWLCVAVALGAATGYFLFGWKKSVIIDVTEHCH
uniref:Copper transport protein n=1 Tax=Homalodisca liturata TaxID=320908 RepID=A0A1B6IF45_9HEMI